VARNSPKGNRRKEEQMFPEKPSIAVIGLGYVGLPLAVQFARAFRVVGLDTSEKRIAELRAGTDRTLQVSAEDLQRAGSALSLTSDPRLADGADLIVVTVPTPITASNAPDLRPLEGGARAAGRALRPGGTVVFESTVYPGCTEEFCVPIIENESGLKLDREFFVGYSPERVNPGDQVHTVDRIVKVTSGSTPEAAAFIDRVYSTVISAGTYRASSIRVAEAAKVIENTQRDLNIAFVNELAVMFNKLGLDTSEVLAAASTKWNFLPFRPGLVGGHCIGVDPYYLTYKAQEVGHHPEIILAGRRLNDSMGTYVASELVKLMIRQGHPVAGSRVLVLGITFKEDCPDIRNTRVVDVVRELSTYGCSVDVFDPWADPQEVQHEYGLRTLTSIAGGVPYDGVMLAVGHRQFAGLNPRDLVTASGVVYDVKSFWPRTQVDKRL
jgi:UDP-N-acetyl-D-glucosamine/UDP-N-acetyl-D-galactosamine dehydrogenase